MKGTLFVISAPSGAGKTSLIQALVAAMPGLQISISHTTRAIRPGEKDHQHYHFVEQEKFKALLAEKIFLEYAQVFGNYYGTSRAWVEETLDQGIDVILEIDWQGGLQIQKLMPETLSIFILPPSREALRERLQTRGQDADATIESRLCGSVLEMMHYKDYQYLLINDDFERTLSDLIAIITASRLRIQPQGIRYGSLIHELLK